MNRAPPPARRLIHALRGALASLRRRSGAPLAEGVRAEPDGGPAATEASGFREFSYRSAAGSRDYMLLLPARRPAAPMPLVVMLHGCTQSPADFATGTRMNRYAEEQGFAVAYPAQSRAQNASLCWNWFQRSNQVRGRGEPAIIAGLTSELVATHGFDRTRVYIAGLSAGGTMAAIVGQAYPEIYAAIGVHSGVRPGIAVDLSSGLAAMRRGAVLPLDARAQEPSGSVTADKTPTIVFHGDADSAVHPQHAAEISARAVRAFVSAAAKGAKPPRESVESGVAPGGHAFTRTAWTQPDDTTVAELWLVHGFGHAWSGGDAAGSFADPQGPDASREMLRFFAAHRVGASA